MRVLGCLGFQEVKSQVKATAPQTMASLWPDLPAGRPGPSAPTLTPSPSPVCVQDKRREGGPKSSREPALQGGKQDRVEWGGLCLLALYLGSAQTASWLQAWERSLGGKEGRAGGLERREEFPATEDPEGHSQGPGAVQGWYSECRPTVESGCRPAVDSECGLTAQLECKHTMDSECRLIVDPECRPPVHSECRPTVESGCRLAVGQSWARHG